MPADDYRVKCGRHNYDTLHSMDIGTAIQAARMHAMLPCTEVKVIGIYGNEVQWQEREEQPSKPEVKHGS